MRGRLRAGALAVLCVVPPLSGLADGAALRVATFNTELSRKGPGLLLRDVLAGDDPGVIATLNVVAAVSPDVLVLQGIDWDHGGVALTALAEALGAMGVAYPYRFAGRPNTGMTTTLDLDGDGRTATARDAQGYGRFAGQGGMALLSRLPLGDVRDFTALLWRDLPGHRAPQVDGVPFPDARTFDAQRLSSTAHWDVPVALPDGRSLRLLTWHATPPVFDGPEDRNGWRNHDEAALWLRHLDGALGVPAPDGPVIVLGDANLDVADGEGRPAPMAALLAHPRLQDPRPRGTLTGDGVNAGHTGDPALDTADWDDTRGPGNLRVDYVLPSRDFTVTDAGIVFPEGEAAGRHGLVWVDLTLP